MELAALLPELRSARDLPRLLTALGLELRHTVLPPGALPLPTGAAMAAGAPDRLEWIGVATRPALANARHLALALRQQGRLAVVLALDPDARQLAVAAGVDRTAAWCLPLDTPSAADLDRLARLGRAAGRGATPLGAALEVVGILEAEEVGRRFFQAFQAVASRMAAELSPAPPRGGRETLALIQLTRVLFLYFVQAKGWLDGQPDFLRRAVDQALGRHRRLHRDLFRPLFFGTLNRRPADRGRARRFGRIPFLNGGLFEPHPLERLWRGEIPNGCWRDAFDALFERFVFTATEGPEAGVIAPDMLGRVFEGLMASEERRTSGTFYTPTFLVRQLLDAGLGALVAERMGCGAEEAAALLERPPAALQPLLAGVRILDPAVGSGAFLLGALERLAALRAGEAAPAEVRRRILAQNLYGVDLNPMAVRLTELRLWLALIAVEPDGPGAAVAPLPNLDGLVRQGDSLLDPASFLARLGARPERGGARLRRVREAFIAANGAEKRDLLRLLREAEARALAECLEQAAHRLEGEITECLLEARMPTLFGERRGLDRPLRQRLARLRGERAQVRRLHRRLVREAEVPWFSPEIHFGDVLASGGFDLVAGNPPWVRAEELAPATRVALAARFRCWRGGGPGFVHQPDLSLAFVERGLELLAPGGVLAFLLPAKLATAGYGRSLRRALVDGTTIHVLADLSRAPGLFDATAYPMALVAARRPPPPLHTARLALDRNGPAWPQARLARDGTWILGDPRLLDALLTLHGVHPRLGERFVPQLGVKTGANEIFLDPPATVEASLLWTALRGRDLRPFRHRAGVRLLFPHAADGRPYPRLPEAAARYLRPHEAVLRARVDYAGGPPWTLFRIRPALAPHRVAWPDLARRLVATPLVGAGTTRLLPLNSCYLVTAPDARVALALAAWLNSTWLRVAARAAADVAASGFARFNARVVGALPLPPGVLDDPRLTRLAERGTRGEAVQEELDGICAEHLALAPAVRAVLARAPGAGAPPAG